MQFETVYDIANAGCRLGYLVLVGLALVIAALVPWLRRSPPEYPPPANAEWHKWGVPFFAVWTLLAFVTTWAQYWSLLRDIRTGRAQELEGVVTDFRAAPDYKGTERFHLGDREFSYSRFATKQGFHTLSADGGPIANGAHVRVLYMNDHILRLEIARVRGG